MLYNRALNGNMWFPMLPSKISFWQPHSWGTFHSIVIVLLVSYKNTYDNSFYAVSILLSMLEK